jgi:hypothetical protein
MNVIIIKGWREPNENFNNSYEVDFNAAGIASGVYFYRIETNDFLSIKKMVILK